MPKVPIKINNSAKTLQKTYKIMQNIIYVKNTSCFAAPSKQVKQFSAKIKHNMALMTFYGL